ncbi:MAG: FAD-dependent oxidoreductase [Clostridia bacterium]|nr:FAD-dependent oxidoreductase [Clostridia bacterium]
MNYDYDVIIVGAGASGMTAALYALRGGKSVLIIEKETVGGQISFSPRVENFPTIKEISGQDLSDRLFDQIMDQGVAFELETVTAIESLEKGFKVTTDYHTYTAKAVIIAAGVKHRHLGLPKEQEFIGNGVYYCALCDGAFYEGEEVMLIGDGNSALQYALYLSNICKKVTVVTLFDYFAGEPMLVNRLKERENVEIIMGYASKEFIGEDKFEGIRFKETYGDKILELRKKAVFVAIGQVADNGKYANLVDLDKQGFIVADESTCTRTPGIYAAGDCRTKLVRQLTTAVGDGANAATQACSFIDREY